MGHLYHGHVKSPEGTSYKYVDVHLRGPLVEDNADNSRQPATCFQASLDMHLPITTANALVDIIYTIYIHKNELHALAKDQGGAPSFQHHFYPCLSVSYPFPIYFITPAAAKLNVFASEFGVFLPAGDRFILNHLTCSRYVTGDRWRLGSHSGCGY